jgi:hypothetical protein
MPADMLVLGYMKSCIQETIRGGAVTVGREQSEVSAGNVVRTRVNCDGGRMQLTSAQSNNSAAMAFRSPPNAKGPRKGSKVHLTLFGASPIFDVGGGGELVVERIDIPGERHEFKLESNTLVQGRFFDMAASGTSLVPGGVYRSLAGQGEIVFRVDPQAQSGRIPAISRLVRFSR